LNHFLQNLRAQLPGWVIEWLEIIIPLTQVTLILLGAWLLYRVLRRLIGRVARGYALPLNVVTITRRIVGLLIFGGAVLWSLERFGASGDMLWAAFTSFAAVGAVAFFAAWSVLSNIFCALMIFTTRMFWPGDTVEVIENGEKPGLKGRVLDINLIFTTLEESGGVYEGTTLKVPNTMFFQRAVRRWHGSAPALPPAKPAAAASEPAGESR
jgi:small-conductance mechanosensitive channel